MTNLLPPHDGMDAGVRATQEQLPVGQTILGQPPWHRSAHWIMCEAIRHYVTCEEKKESFKQDALNAWESYQENGMHLTLEEADAWLAKLEAGEDAEIPKCHD